MQTSISATQSATQLYLTDKKLFSHFMSAGAPLPFGLVRLRQDRKTGCLGGVPYRQIGGKFVYCPDEIQLFLSGLPIIQVRKPAHTKKTGRPAAGELAEAARKNISIKELRGAA